MNTMQRRRRPFDPARLDTLRFFDAQAARRYAPIEPRTFYAAIASGKLPAFRIGGNGKLVVRRDDLDHFIAATRVESKLDAIVNETLAELRSDH